MAKRVKPVRLSDHMKAIYAAYAGDSGIALRKLWQLRAYTLLADVRVQGALAQQGEELDWAAASKAVLSALAKNARAAHPDVDDELYGQWVILAFALCRIAFEQTSVAAQGRASPQETMKAAHAMACKALEEIPMSPLEDTVVVDSAEPGAEEVEVPLRGIFGAESPETRESWVKGILTLILAQDAAYLRQPQLDIYAVANPERPKKAH